MMSQVPISRGKLAGGEKRQYRMAQILAVPSCPHSSCPHHCMQLRRKQYGQASQVVGLMSRVPCGLMTPGLVQPLSVAVSLCPVLQGVVDTPAFEKAGCLSSG
jgi:hypothetical protein